MATTLSSLSSTAVEMVFSQCEYIPCYDADDVPPERVMDDLNGLSYHPLAIINDKCGCNNELSFSMRLGC